MATKLTKKEIALSKTMSWLLRHGIVEKGLAMDVAGFIPVADMLALPEFTGYSFDQIKQVVDTNDKKRFQMVEKTDPTTNLPVWLIRANQGHSTEVGAQIVDGECLTLTQFPPNTYGYHATTEDAWLVIQKEGLKPMSRKHVHLAMQPDASAGLRKNRPVILQVDLTPEIIWYVSANNVILTEATIPPNWITRLRL
jgi:2'-phosphotransferase